MPETFEASFQVLFNSLREASPSGRAQPESFPTPDEQQSVPMISKARITVPIGAIEWLLPSGMKPSGQVANWLLEALVLPESRCPAFVFHSSSRADV